MKNMMIAVMYLVVMLGAPSVWAGKNADTDTVYKNYEESSQCNVFLSENVVESDETCALGWLPGERWLPKEKGGTRKWWLKMFSERGVQVNLHLKLAPKCIYQLDGRGKWHKCSILSDTEDKIVLKGHHKGFGFKLDIEKIHNVRRSTPWSLTYLFACYWYYG
jgi:hypothetical protein